MPRRARAGATAIVAFLLLLGAGTARSQDAPAPDSSAVPAASGFVNDEAGAMDEPARAKLEAFLDQLKRKTGAEFAVLTVKTTAPSSPSDYKVKVFERWGLGRKGHDDGLLMLVAVEEREVLFETGYGLEGTLPDGLQSRIVRDEVAPRFRSGDFAGGITAGVLACAVRIAAASGTTLEWDGRELRYREPARRGGSPGMLALILFVVLFVVLSRLGGGMGGPYRRGGWGGGFWGGGFGGGGFGGGSFGGGGFGGGSFGGFGGGASGGGGGGGRW